jgi:hypothetical protein
MKTGTKSILSKEFDEFNIKNEVWKILNQWEGCKYDY